MHIFFNMMSLAGIGSLLEKQFGTLMFTFTVLWGVLLTSAVYTLCAILLHITFGIETLMYQHSVGFSGVIFQLSVLEANLNPNSARSVFGFFRVPAYLYPWALLIAIQFILPQVSFVGHLSGIFVGTLQLYGVLEIIIPTDPYLKVMEEWRCLRLLTSSVSFVRTPDGSDAGAHSRHPGELRTALLRSVQILWKFIRDVLVTLSVIVFGRGRSNENIQLVTANEDEWAGLPPPPPGNCAESATV